MLPTGVSAIGADFVTASSTSFFTTGSWVTSRVTMTLSATVADRMTSRVFLSILMSITDSSRPNDRPWITGRGLPAGSFTEQLYCWWLCPVKKASTFGVAVVAIVCAIPGATLQACGPPPSVPSPWCMVTMSVLMPRRSSRFAVRSMACTSSPNLRPCTAAGVTTDGRSCKVMPMMPIGMPPSNLTVSRC